MTAPRSRALARLDAAIAAAHAPVEQTCLMAERAGLLARLGRVDEAREALAGLRERQAQLVHPALSVWLALAEAMVEQQRQQPAAARDRIRRAHALSAAARERPLIALSAAWHAQADFTHGDAPAMARHVAEALQEAAADHHAARARASLVAAQAYHWAGQTEGATPWYQRAREHALAEGDDATLAALMMYRACIGGAQLCRAAVFEPALVDAAAVREALLGAEASRNFDAHLGRSALRPRVAAIHARLLLVQGDAAGALAGFEALRPQAGAQELSPLLQADKAWCLWQLGRKDDALTLAQVAEEAASEDAGDDDRAALHGRLSQLFAALDQPQGAARHDEAAQAQRAALAERQQQLVTLLDEALRQVPGL